MSSQLSGVLSDPTLTLFNNNGVVLAENDNWRDNPAPVRDRIIQTGFAPSDDRESVIVAVLPEGSYTAVVRGQNATSGIALAEVYNTTTDNGEKLINISTRSLVSTGDNVSISGIIVRGSVPERIIFRGIGPSLQGRVPTPLQDPSLELFDANGASIAANDNWRQQDPVTVADIMSSGLAPTDDRESAIAQTLAPGAYTAVLRGVNGTSGSALVEAYDRD